MKDLLQIQGIEGVRLGIAAFLFLLFVVLAVLRLTRHSQTLRQTIKVPILAIFILLAIYDIFYMASVPFPPSILPYYYALLWLFIAILIIRLVLLFFFDVFLVRSKKYRAPKLLKEITAFFLFIVAVVLILQDTLHVQVTTVLATSAIITVVLGLALQETLGNLFAGLALHLDPPFQVGDWIHIGDISGKVEEISWRATKLRTVNNDYIVIPNGTIAKEKLQNHTSPAAPHAVRIDINTSYSVSPNRVSEIVNKVLSETENVTMNPPPEIRVNNYQDYVLNYQIKFYFHDYGLIEPTVASIRKSLWYQFRRNDIEIPFPAKSIFIHEREEELDNKEQKLRHLTSSLRNIYLFAELESDELRMIARSLNELYFAEKELVIKEGDQDDSFFVIDQGEVEVFITSAHMNKKVLTVLKEGDFFGEMALLTGEKRSASVRALTDVRVYELKKEGFRKVLEEKPLILDEISNVLSRRKDQLADLIAQSTGVFTEEANFGSQEAKSRIVSRIRSYFGL